MEEKKVSKNVLERILTSQRFITALDKSTSITSDTGYETSFGLAKKIFGRKLLFTPTIEIGDHKSVGNKVGLKRVREDYEKVTGEKVNIRNLDEYPEFVSYSISQNPISIPLENMDFNKFLKNKFDAEDFYALIDFHTHPNGSASPSIVDLNGLRFQKKHNYSGDLNVSPIGVVAGVNKNERYVPLLLFQENDEEIGKVFDDNGNLMAHSSRFMSNEEFEQAEKEITAYWTMNSDKEDYYLSLIFGKGPQTNFYNRGLMTYDRENKKVLLHSDLIGKMVKADLSKFEFMESKEE